MNESSKASRNKKVPEVSLDSLKRIFTAPESENSSLWRIEKEISENLQGFLSQHVTSGDLPPSALERDFIDTHIPEDPMYVSDQADFLLQKVVAQSVHVSAPSFVGHMTSAVPYFMLPLAKIMMALNQNLVKIETSKAFTPLERQVVGMLHRLVYARDNSFYKENTHAREHSIGVFCSDGTIANMTAVWVARNRLLAPRGAFGGIGSDGLSAGLKEYNLNGLCIIASQRAHYSFQKAADLIGLGKKNVISIPTDDRFRVKTKDLKNAIQDAQRQKTGIVCVIGIAGTTETGSVDPLSEIARVCEDARVHFHCDAAWGGPTLFSKHHAPKLKGIELADSVTFDAHKQLYVPVGAGLVLFKDPHALNAIEHSAQYIVRSGSRDIGRHTLEGTRPGMALLVHSALRVIGRRGYELLIDIGISKAQDFSNLIHGSPDFELISKPELNLLTYRYIPKELRSRLEKADAQERKGINEFLNNLTMSIQKEQRTQGKTFVSRTTIDPERYQHQNITVFRVVLCNPLTTLDILEKMLDEQRELAHRILKSELKDEYAKYASN